MSEPIISARALTKSYGDFQAVKGLDFDVAPGESFGLLGPNGAGKSTTMRMLSGVSTRTPGELRILGMDPTEHGPLVRNQLGIVPQQDWLDTDLNVVQNLVTYGRYFGIPRKVARERAEQLLEFVRLTDKRTAHIDDLSGGMKRRVTIARGLVNDPKVFLLDEPTTGLDPQARHVLWDQLYRLKERGTTLILTTHYMDEAEQLCDRLIVVDGGLIKAEGTPLELIRRYTSREVVEMRFGTGQNDAAAAQLQGIGDRVEPLADRVLIAADDGEAALRAALDRGLDPIASLVRRSSLEDVFLRLTGRSLIE